MATTFDVIVAIVSIVSIESILLWMIYTLRSDDIAEIKNETHKQSNITFRMKKWYSQHINTLFRSITLYVFLYSCMALLFWGILFITLMDEAAELIGLTWFLGPSFLLWGIIDGYFEKSKIYRDKELTDKKMRPLVLYLYNESKLGNLEAKNKLSELSHRNDKAGIITKRILHELDQ
ncbi:MAG: hypothetical protein JW779_01285 [Candidatus Thorarchaeota archaeon]|nr:hypothetical protein [Candidatus Thorarchaeota archaeon]